MYLRIFDKLTPRERQIIEHSMVDESAKHIANKLLISPRTVDTYKRKIRRKLEIPAGRRNGLIKDLVGIIDEDELRHFPVFYSYPHLVLNALEHRLTTKEYNFVNLLTGGMKVGSAAKLLGISPRTLDGYCSRIKEKLGLKKDLRRLPIVINEWFTKEFPK